MNLPQQIARHFREVHFGVNWTWSNLKDNLADITLQEATTQIYNLNTIAVLVYHVNYYVGAVLQVLQGGELTASDKFSFACPPINSEEDWNAFRNKALTEAETLAGLIETLPEEKLWEIFTDEKYGNYYRNLHGIIEHTHYHLGQIALMKKILRQQNEGF